MHIDDTQLPFIPAWEGALDTSGATFTPGGHGPQASIGQPTYWPLHAPEPPAAAGVTAVRPPAGWRYGLARFPFTLRPGDGDRVQRADFSLRLQAARPGPAPIAYDAYPATTATIQEGEVSASLGPDFKFAGAEASLGGVAGSIKLRRAAAAITLSGVGESAVQWTFQPRGGGPLLAGSLVVYVVVAVPAGETAVRAAAQLSALLNTPFGSLVGRLPDEAAAQVSWLLS